MSNQFPALDPTFLEFFRCPEAVHDKTRDDPGRLRLAHGCWLVCDESGLKYPVIDGIPILLIEEGQKWRSVAESDLPVPPPES